jgi:hypothetical protein
MIIKTERASAGLAADLVEAVAVHREQTGSYTGSMEAVEAAITQVAIERFEPKIRHAFDRAGVPLEPGPLTSQGLAAAVGGILGVDLPSLSIGDVKAAIEAKLSESLSADLGMNIQGVLSGGIKQAIEVEVALALARGAATIVGRAKARKARRQATFAQAGYAAKDEQKKVMNRLWQKRYRRFNRLVWDK